MKPSFYNQHRRRISAIKRIQNLVWLAELQVIPCSAALNSNANKGLPQVPSLIFRSIQREAGAEAAAAEAAGAATRPGIWAATGPLAATGAGAEALSRMLPSEPPAPRRLPK